MRERARSLSLRERSLHHLKSLSLRIQKTSRLKIKIREIKIRKIRAGLSVKMISRQSQTDQKTSLRSLKRVPVQILRSHRVGLRVRVTSLKMINIAPRGKKMTRRVAAQKKMTKKMTKALKLKSLTKRLKRPLKRWRNVLQSPSNRSPSRPKSVPVRLHPRKCVRRKPAPLPPPPPVILMTATVTDTIHPPPVEDLGSCRG